MRGCKFTTLLAKENIYRFFNAQTYITTYNNMLAGDLTCLSLESDARIVFGVVWVHGGAEPCHRAFTSRRRIVIDVDAHNHRSRQRNLNNSANNININIC